MKPQHEALQHVLKGVGHTTTPDALSKRGIRRVRSLKPDELWTLIQRAMRLSLEQSPDQTASAADTRAQLQPLLDLREVLLDGRESVQNPDDPSSHFSTKPADFTPEQAIRHMKIVSENVPSPDLEWTEQLRKQLEHHIDHLYTGGQDAMRDWIQGLRLEAVREAQKAAAAHYEEEIIDLRQRMQGMQALLNQTAQKFDRSLNLLTGLPSGFRDEQRGTRSEERKEMMNGLFEMNRVIPRD